MSRNHDWLARRNIAMRLFFVNTDAISYGGVSRHDDWLRRSVVITGGDPKYKDAIARIPAGARVLVYVNGLGVVAVGLVHSFIKTFTIY